MTGKEAIRCMLERSRMITGMILGDLTDADLLVRPVPGANHIAWQLGHLACSEHRMVGNIAPDAMPPLPEGFEAKHAKETAASDSPSDFYTKAEYMKVLDEQRKGTLAYLESLTDDDLSKPLDLFNGFIKSYGDMLILPGSHELMHVGQYSSVRRKLGKAHAF